MQTIPISHFVLELVHFKELRKLCIEVVKHIGYLPNAAFLSGIDFVPFCYLATELALVSLGRLQLVALFT